VPPQYRAKPYETPVKAQETAKPTEGDAQSPFKAASENTPPPQGKPRPKMSEGFNAKSRFNDPAANSKPEQKPDDAPEAEL